MPCTYILFSSTGQKFYTGSSREDDSESRIRSHNSGRVRSTKYGRPWVLVHQELFDNYTDARKRELYFKTGEGREWIKAHLNKK